MAQLANTPARVVLLLPHGGPPPSLVALLSLVDAAKRAPDAIVAFDGAPLDESPVLVPRDAWLELVTLGGERTRRGRRAAASRARRSLAGIARSHPDDGRCRSLDSLRSLGMTSGATRYARCP